MKVHSLQFKFLATLISAMLAITVFIGGLSINEVDNYIQEETKNLINTTCSNEALQINDIFGDMEKSVKIMESYALSLFAGTEDIYDRDRQNRIIELSSDMFYDVAINTEGAIAYYLRFDPSISDATSGIFCTKTADTDEYVLVENTDLSLYDRDDTEHVGWYWQPYDAGEPIWMAPYHNQNLDIFMISYTIPLYHENQFVGVVGMDFDYTVLTDRIHRIKIYENGFAHLELDGNAIHDGTEGSNGAHKDYDSEKYMRVSEELTNGMTLVFSASYDDIRQIRYEIAYKILYIAVLLAVLFSVIVILTVKKIVKPLKKLTEAATKLSNEDYDVEIESSDTHEIKLLSTAFENMTKHLKEHEKLQQRLAYCDSLTGLKNTTAYKEWISDYNRRIQEGDASFGIVMLDLNLLKETNDNYGHYVGDKLISTAAQISADSFKRSPVFRIGGDEFLVILENRDLEDRENLFKKFEADCKKSYAEEENAKVPISIAMGFAEFDPKTDTKFDDVFNRADNEMYKNKRNMKIPAI